MSLKPIDEQHFYLDGKLIDLVWINFQAKKNLNAANYHGVTRNLNWLRTLAVRLMSRDVGVGDVSLAREKLRDLGLAWYLEQ